MTDTPDTTPAEACVHEYTLNVQLTHAWCQKCDLIIPITEGQSVMVLIAARATAAQRERILGRATECKTCGEVHPGCLAYDDGHPYQPRWAYPDSTLMDRLADLLGGTP